MRSYICDFHISSRGSSNSCRAAVLAVLAVLLSLGRLRGSPPSSSETLLDVEGVLTSSCATPCSHAMGQQCCLRLDDSRPHQQQQRPPQLAAPEESSDLVVLAEEGLGQAVTSQNNLSSRNIAEISASV